MATAQQIVNDFSVRTGLATFHKNFIDPTKQATTQAPNTERKSTQDLTSSEDCNKKYEEITISKPVGSNR